MKKHRKSKDEPLHFGLNDLCIALGALGGLAYEGYEKWKNRKRGE